jgi:hypothetical protein
MRYAMFVCGDESQDLTEQQQEERLQAFMAFQADMEAQGTLVTLQRLQPTSTATAVKKRSGATVIADGPFAETKEQNSRVLCSRVQGLGRGA